MRKLATLAGALTVAIAPSPALATSTHSSHSTGNAGTSGVYNQPQPNSTADKNSGGANGGCLGTTYKGDYCSTRNGSSSLNGNGGGKATGKPCAGCVGRADNKNPHGQFANGSDHNNGYECDGNNGIGKTNPAHTGCSPTSSTPQTPPPSCTSGPSSPPCSTPPPCSSGASQCTPPPCTSGVTTNCTPTSTQAGVSPTSPTAGAVSGANATRLPRHGTRRPSSSAGKPPAANATSTGGTRATTPSHTVFVSLTKTNTPSSSQSSGTLPFTGYDVGIVLLAGGLLVGLGLLVRRRFAGQL